MKNKIILLLAVIAISAFSSTAQQITDHIPANTMTVSSLNMGSLHEKAKFGILKGLEVIKEIDKEIAEDISEGLMKADSSDYLNIEKHGFNINSRMFVNADITDSTYEVVVLFNVADISKFNVFVEKLMDDDRERKIEKLANYQLVEFAHDTYLAWNNDVAAFVTLDFHYKYFKRYEENFREEVEESKEESTDEDKYASDYYGSDYEESKINWDAYYNYKDSMRMVLTINRAAEILNGFGAESLTNSKIYNENIDENADGTVWYNVNRILDIADSYDDFDIPEVYIGMLKTRMMDNHLFANVTFDQSKVVTKFAVLINNKIAETYSKTLNKKINKKFVEYINGSQCSGLYSISVNVKEYNKALLESIKSMSKFEPSVGEYTDIVIDALDVFIDEDAINNLFKGDVMVAHSGFDLAIDTVYDYVYDDDYNYVTDTVVDTIFTPKFIIMSTIGDQENVEKLLKITHVYDFLGNVGMSLGLGMGSISDAVERYITIKDGILFISNDTLLIQNKVPVSQQLTKEQKKMFKNNSTVVYVNADVLTESYSKMFGQSYDEDISIIKSMLSRNFNDAHFTMSAIKKNKITGELVINMDQNEVNSFASIIKMINELYLKTNH